MLFDRVRACGICGHWDHDADGHDAWWRRESNRGEDSPVFKSEDDPDYDPLGDDPFPEELE